jgi:transcriptional regulator with XRE-family HTH domain
MPQTTNALRRVRKARGLRLQDVADVVGVHFTTVHHWEYGRMRPYPKSLRKLEVLFGMTADELLVPENGNGGPRPSWT